MSARSPFEVLGISKTADADEVRSAYRKLALRWHPDKNLDNAEEATERFKEIQSAFSVLSDPISRAGLDDDGMVPSDDKPGKRSNDFVGLVNLSPYFNPGCFDGFGEAEDNFYAVYADVFARVDAEELRLKEFDLEKSRAPAPLFGSHASTDDVIRSFYNWWEGFTSKMTFAWVDEYDPAEAPNRGVRRLVEKENKKKRDTGRKKRSEQVRSLVLFVKSMDKRVMKMAMAAKAAADAKARAKAEALELREKEKQEARRKRKEHMEALLAATAPEEDSPAEGFYRADDDTELFSAKGKRAAVDDDDDDELVLYRCEACSKTFKSAKQLENHEKSRKHLDVIAALREMFLDEDRQDGDAAVDDSPMSEADASSFPYDSSVGDAARAGAGRPAVEATSSDDGSVADVPAVDAVSVPKDTKPIDVSDDGDDASGDGDAPGMGIDGCAAAVATKLTAKQKREMRKAKKADKVVAAASSTVVESSDGPALDALECSVCHDEFPSRNKLMQHIKKSGHAVPLRSAPEVPVGKAGKGKRR